MPSANQRPTLAYSALLDALWTALPELQSEQRARIDRERHVLTPHIGFGEILAASLVPA